MNFRKCFVCGEEAVIWDLEKHSGGFRHRNSVCPSTVETLKLKLRPTHDEAAADAVEASTGPFVREVSRSKLARMYEWFARYLPGVR